VKRSAAAGLEAFLARLYTDADARAAFAADPRAEALRAGLDPADVDALASIDTLGLELAADSFARKRAETSRVQRISSRSPRRATRRRGPARRRSTGPGTGG
jgi:hypothetical protein